jgi:hypothetical protein
VTIALVLGFLLTAASGLVLRVRGRRAGAGTLVVVGSVALITVGLTQGREAISDLMLGALLGLPVVIGALAARVRIERVRPSS